MTQDIRELLELAALACGYAPISYDELSGLRVYCHRANQVIYWHPGQDDGDCFRMETELGIEHEWYELGIASSVYVGKDLAARSLPSLVRIREAYADHNGNKNAARRLASLRVAAELGRRM